MVILATALDALILLGLIGTAIIAATGGGHFSVAGITIRATSVGNPLLAVFVCATLRVLATYRIRSLLLARAPRDLAETASVTAALIERWCQSGERARTQRLMLGIVALSIALKVWQALSQPGFLTGDDVEIHEMTLSYLFGKAWPVWDLRSPVYPFLFVLPAQAVALWAGVSDVGALVGLGRCVVALLSAVSLVAVYRIGLAQTGLPRFALLAVALLAISKLHNGYASTELPRTVAGALLAVSYLLLVARQPDHLKTILGGVLLGLAASLRFSECIYIVAAIVSLLWMGRTVHAAVTVLVSLATAATLLLAGDALYWGKAWHSVSSIVDYTLVTRQSSRGFQAWHYYASHLTGWTTPGMAALALLGVVWARRWELAPWVVVPLLALSTLPHKEERYLVPMMPFVALLAAHGIRALLAEKKTFDSADPWRGKALLVGVAIVIVSLIGEAAGFRLQRSSGAVRQIHALHGSIGSSRVVAEQSWRFGGWLYVPASSQLVAMESLSPDELTAVLCAANQRTVVLLWTADNRDALERASACGFSSTSARRPDQYMVLMRQP